MYESALREWPRDRARDGGLHQARLALACAVAGQHDRVTVEGRKALAIARTTKSSIAARELEHLRQTIASGRMGESTTTEKSVARARTRDG
jgi:hypothetical protein